MDITIMIERRLLDISKLMYPIVGCQTCPQTQKIHKQRRDYMNNKTPEFVGLSDQDILDKLKVIEDGLHQNKTS